MADRNEATKSQSVPSFSGVAVELRESDESLAARAATDAEAFAELYLRYVVPIRRYCGLRLRDWYAVDDVTSEIIVKALENLHKTSVHNVRPWLFTIAHHQLTDRYRRRRDECDLDETTELPSGSIGPEDTVVARSEVKALREAISMLPPAQAQVIELRLAGLDGPEIRQILNRSRSWVDTTQYRALISLRRTLNSIDIPEER